MEMDPREVSAIRRELMEYHAPDGIGPMSYLYALQAGIQVIRPAGPIDLVAADLSRQERLRLGSAGLYFVDGDMCALVAAAHPDMPVFAVRPEMLPSPYGFVVFDTPLATIAADNAAEIQQGRELARQLLGTDVATSMEMEHAISEPVQITAAVWGPCPYETPMDAPYGSVWITFYASNQGDYQRTTTAPLARRAGIDHVVLPPMIPENDAILRWGPPPHSGIDEVPFHVPADPKYTSSWARILFATFRLSAQRSIAATDAIPLPRPERRRCQRQGYSDGDVQVMTLRHRIRQDLDLEERLEAEAAKHPAAPGQRAVSCRFLVRGHTRWQHYPRHAEHRPIWISPYVKGPDGAPFRAPERVRVVRRPKTEPPAGR